MQPPRFGPTNMVNFHDTIDDLEIEEDDSRNMGLMKKQYFKW
jgi:hypothetical protein